MPDNVPGSSLIRAAGAVAWRPGPDGEPEILLVHRRRYDDWSLPKGKTEPGEPLPVTATREVLEEGGARITLGRRLISVRYNAGGRPKRVHYWAARVTATDDHAVPNAEVDLIDWMPVTRAVERVSYAHDHGVLADFARFPPHTVPLILLRHAKAVGKSDWNRGDANRALDDAGRTEAKSLADLLACFAPRPVLISSPAVRCLETLRPLAELTGARVREEPALYLHHQASSGTGRADSAPSIAALVREAIASAEPTVFCAHRENIPDLQAAVLAVLSVGSDLPNDWDDSLPTAGFWILNVPATATPTAGARTAEDRAAGDRAAEDRAAEDRAAENRAAEDRAAGDRAAEDRASGNRAAGDWAAGDWAVEAAASPGSAAGASLPPTEVSTAPAAVSQAAQASAATARWRWLQDHGWPGHHPIPRTGASGPGLDASAPAPRSIFPLVSADRYDLSGT